MCKYCTCLPNSQVRTGVQRSSTRTSVWNIRYSVFGIPEKEKKRDVLVNVSCGWNFAHTAHTIDSILFSDSFGAEEAEQSTTAL